MLKVWQTRVYDETSNKQYLKGDALKFQIEILFGYSVTWKRDKKHVYSTTYIYFFIYLSERIDSYSYESI